MENAAKELPIVKDSPCIGQGKNQDNTNEIGKKNQNQDLLILIDFLF